jgi:large subunit ribosomal protein L23
MARAKKAETKVVKQEFSKPTERDFEVIKAPKITEKTMTLMQENNKVTVEVAPDSNRTEVKLAFQRIFQVKVTNVQIVNVRGKTTTRGTRYKGHISGFKKAIVTIAEGEAIDLFKD